MPKTIMRSPLTGEVAVLEDTLSTKLVAAAWERVFQIRLPQPWVDLEKIQCYSCPTTRLRFFKPDELAGAADLYESLQEFDWYYMPNKWEHDCAVKLINEGESVLEIGCGRGEFVAKLCDAGITARGIELNTSAVREATDLKRAVSEQTLEEVAEIFAGTFDVVCHFQVLEHVSDIHGFLMQCLACLKPNGKLIFAVPNMRSFIEHDRDNLLNYPPHHMSQWFPESIRQLQTIFPITLLHHEFEPLAKYHLQFYVAALLSKLPRVFPKQSKREAIATRFLIRALRPDLIRNRLLGQTQLACFQRSINAS